MAIGGTKFGAGLLGAMAAGRSARLRGRKAGALAGAAARAAGFSPKFASRVRKVGAGMGLAGAAVAAGKAIHGMAEEALRAQAKLAAVSGSMAMVMAERQWREIARDQRQGAKIAGTARDLATNEQRLKDVAEPIDSLLTNLKNTVLARIEKTLADILTPVSLLADVLNRRFGGDPVANGLADDLRKLADDAAAKRAAGAAGSTRPTTTSYRP